MRASASSLDGRVAIVTGGAGGIGAATVRLLAERGARVVVADLAVDRAQAVAAEVGDAAAACARDLADPASVAATVDFAIARFGRLDMLDNNAAFLDPDMASKDRDVEHMDLDVWDRTFAVNLRGTMLACRAALPSRRHGQRRDRQHGIEPRVAGPRRPDRPMPHPRPR